MLNDTTITPDRTIEKRFDEAVSTWCSYRAKLDETDIADQEANDFALDALITAEARTYEIPAQTISDFRAKFELLFIDPSCTPNEDALSALFADLRRLTGNEPSRTFSAKHWLADFEDRGGGWVERGGEVFLFARDKEHLEYWFWLLETRGTRGAVLDLIRQRIAEREDGHALSQ